MIPCRAGNDRCLRPLAYLFEIIFSLTINGVKMFLKSRIRHIAASHLLQATLRPVSSVGLPTSRPSPIWHTLKVN